MTWTHDGQRSIGMPADMLLAGDNVNGVFQPGFLCYGIPIGSNLVP